MSNQQWVENMVNELRQSERAFQAKLEEELRKVDAIGAKPHLEAAIKQVSTLLESRDH